MSHHRVLQPTTFMGSLSHCITRLSGTLLPLHCISEILISLHDHGISKDLHPTPYHEISISLHYISRDLYPTSYHGIPILLHCISLHISAKGLHPFTSRDLHLGAYLKHLHPLHHCTHQTKPTLHHIHDPSGAPRPSWFTFLLGLRAWTPASSFLLCSPPCLGLRVHSAF